MACCGYLMIIYFNQSSATIYIYVIYENKRNTNSLRTIQIYLFQNKRNTQKIKADGSYSIDFFTPTLQED